MYEPVLRKLKLFGNISEDDERALASICAGRAREVLPGVDLLLEGQDPKYVHLVISGFACRYIVLATGRRQIVAFLLPGDFCDLHSYIMKSSDHCIATLSRSTIVEIPRSKIEELLARPALINPMFMSTLVDEAILRAWIANIGQRPADKRIAHLICEIRERLNNVGLAHGKSFDLPVTQGDLGDTIGTSVVHTNRALKALREAGFVSVKQKRVTIENLEKLKDFCGFRSNYLLLGGMDQSPRKSTI